MSGITRIQKSRDDSRRPTQERERGKEVWLKDGDQIFCTSIATGDENDTLLDEIYMYTFRVGTRWVNLLKNAKVDLETIKQHVPEDTRPSHKFAFWAYVYHIIHAEKRVDDWEEVEGPAGKKMFKETVNDFRIISLGFGRSDYVWNQLVEVYSDWGGLNKGVIRAKRTGSGMFDTSYSVTSTPRKEEIPSDKLKEVKDLPAIKDYYMERYGNLPEELDGVDTTSSKEDDISLFS